MAADYQAVGSEAGLIRLIYKTVRTEPVEVSAQVL
jgi:hypothetical protein